MEVLEWRIDWTGTDYHGYRTYTIPSILLIATSFSLLISRPWSYLIALFPSGWLIYRLGFMWLVGFATFHDEGVSSWLTLRRAWTLIENQTHSIIQLTLALLIFSYALIAISRYGFQRWHLYRNGV
jgi:hypothetical protein